MSKKSSEPKDLDSLLKGLAKEFGDNAVNLYGNMPKLDVEKITSGSIGIDHCLGGGYAKGRIIEIWGPEASGKCLTKDTYVWSPDGPLTIDELFSSQGRKASITSRVEPIHVPLINRHGEAEGTSAFTWNNKQPVLAVHLEDGTVTKSTKNHPHLVMSESGNWVWRRTSNLRIGDVVVKLRGAKAISRAPLTSEEVDDLYALGALVADGCFSGPRRLSFTNNDLCVSEVVKASLSRFGFPEPKEYPRANTVEYHFNSKRAVGTYFDFWGLSAGLARDKYVPLKVRTYGPEGISAFLRGYLDCECHLSIDRSVLSVVSASRSLLDDVQQCLQFLGVYCYLRDNPVKEYPDNDYYTLNIGGPNLGKYVDVVGFRSKSRQEKASELTVTGYSPMDTIPNVASLIRDMYEASETTRAHSKVSVDYMQGGHNPTYSSLQKLLSLEWEDTAPRRRLEEIAAADYVYVPIVDIQDAGVEPTFDVAMPDTHSFVANGIVTHNTTLTLHLIAEAQKVGGRCAFIDAEHALDPVYAAGLGVDMDQLLLSQPDHGEQALNIVETLVNSGQLAVIVIDSVAALVPKAELDGEIGDHHMGVQARMMGQACRKLAGAVSNTKTVLVFINQVRSKIGVMFGNPDTTTGGNALKFYASQRIEVKRIGTIKQGEEALGSRTRCKVVKNKVAPPFRTCEFDVIFGKGINKVGEVVDGALTLSLLEKAGSWIKYKGESIAQGREKACEWVEANPEVYAELEAAVRKEMLR